MAKRNGDDPRMTRRPRGQKGDMTDQMRLTVFF